MRRHRRPASTTHFGVKTTRSSWASISISRQLRRPWRHRRRIRSRRRHRSKQLFSLGDVMLHWKSSPVRSARLRLPALILLVLGLGSSTGHAAVESCWRSDVTQKTYNWPEFQRLTADSNVSTPSGRRVSLHNGTPEQTLQVGGKNEFTTFHRVPCPPSTVVPAGFYIMGGVGGGWSVPRSPGIPSGSGSGVTADVGAGFRISSRDLTSWGSINLGVTYFGHDESFPAPYDDLKVRPTVVFYQSASLGPNFQGFAPGQRIAPYLEMGIAESPIRVSALVGSATQWSVAPLLGAGVDYRLDKNWLVHTGVRAFFFDDRRYQLGAGGPVYTVSERAT